MNGVLRRTVWGLVWVLFVGLAVQAGPVSDYLQVHPQVERWLLIETGSSGAFLPYKAWSDEWRDQLERIVDCYVNNTELPFTIPVELAPRGSVFPTAVGYGSLDIGIDVYLAQVGHMLYLDMFGLLPWSLTELSDEELSYLLPSSNFFFLGEYAGIMNYQTYMGPIGQDAGGILGDPRDTLAFILENPESGNELLGGSPEHTVANLSEWFHDYLYHWNLGSSQNPGNFFQEYPYFTDRLSRLPVESFADEVYVSIVGCWSASSLFAQVLRTINIPAQMFIISLEDPYVEGKHKGVMTSIGGVRRYLPHTDDLYTGWLQGANPITPWMSIGWALWNNVWLDENVFFALTTPHSDADTLARMSFDDHNRYLTEASWHMHTYQWWVGVCSYRNAVGCGFNDIGAEVIRALQEQQSLSEAQAESWWAEMVESMQFYGDDVCEACDRAEDFQAQWCSHTGRCDENGWPDR